MLCNLIGYLCVTNFTSQVIIIRTTLVCFDFSSKSHPDNYYHFRYLHNTHLYLYFNVYNNIIVL